MLLGSHFDGISAFPYAASFYGIKAIWATEIEPFPVSVSKHHFPHMRHYGDISMVNGAELEPVDIITFGSPCQDLSVAGKREGLYGQRSGLFMEAIRTIREMREATNGAYPRYAIWENVPGAFSSNRGRDFRAVLEQITQAEIPMPKSGRWAPAGMVRGDGYSVAWRTLDAQYHGVPQRRRRIFLVADFAGQRAPEILFERQSMCWNSQESGKAREEVAGSAGNGTPNASYWDGGQISDTLDCSMLSKQQAMPEKRRFAAVLTPQLYDMTATRYKGGGPTRKGDGAGNGLGVGREGDPMPTMTAGDRHAVFSVDCRNLYENEEISATLQCKATGGYSLNYQNPVRVGYAVRRLTPTEAERLMGFPDGWTEGGSDTARYKALGNSIAVPCLKWIFSQLVKQARG